MNIPNIAIDIVGYSYLLMSSICRIPQIYKLHKTKKGEDISYFMIITQNVSYLLLIVYLVFIESTIMMIVSIGFQVVQNIYISFFIWWYSRQHSQEDSIV